MAAAHYTPGCSELAVIHVGAWELRATAGTGTTLNSHLVTKDELGPNTAAETGIGSV